MPKSFYSKISKADAIRKAEQWITEKKAADMIGEPLVEKDILFSEWAKKWLEIYKKPNVDGNTYHLTYEQNVNNHLIPFFGKSRMQNILPMDVQAFFDSNSKFSESVLKKLHMCLNGIFETAIENDLCRKNPVKHILAKSKRTKNEKHVYTDVQIQKVKEYAKGRMLEVYLLLCTGVRRGELLGLKWSDFSVKDKCIHIRSSIADIQDGVNKSENKVLENLVYNGVKKNPPKWKSYRIIPIDDECVSVIKSIPKDGEYIFPKKNGLPQSPNTWSQKFKRFMDAMHKEYPEVPIITAHELRHTFGTMLRRRGVDIYTIQKIMGHKDIKMTSEIYVHNELDTLRKELKLGTDFVQPSYGKKYRIKSKIKKPALATEQS